MRILIADTSIDMRTHLEEELSKFHSVHTCDDGLTVLEEILSFQPDLLIIDLMLPAIDGVTVLQNLHSAGKMPKVLVLTRFSSDYLQDCLSYLGVSDVILKPCSIHTILFRISDILHTLGSGEAGETQLRFSVHQILLSLGMRTNLSGYRYVMEAVLLLYRDPSQTMTKELYPAVAEICGGTWQQTERVIRLCIQDAWKRHDDKIWQLYFGRDRFGRIPKVSNSAFLCAVVTCAENDTLPEYNESCKKKRIG